MNKGTKQAAVGATVVGTAGKIFMEILNIFDNVVRQSQSIPATMQEMAKHTELIVDSIHDIEAMNKSL